MNKYNIKNQMKHVITIGKYLEKENEVEFFKNASVIFEKLFKKCYRGKKRKQLTLSKENGFLKF